MAECDADTSKIRLIDFGSGCLPEHHRGRDNGDVGDDHDHGCGGDEDD